MANKGSNIKSKLPSRHVSVGPKSAPHRAMYYAMGLTEDEIYEIITSPENFDTISKHFENNDIPIEGKITLSPQNIIKINKHIRKWGIAAYILITLAIFKTI